MTQSTQEYRSVAPSSMDVVGRVVHGRVESNLVYPMDQDYYVVVKLDKEWVIEELEMQHNVSELHGISNKYAVPLNVNTGATVLVYNSDGNYYLIDREHK